MRVFTLLALCSLVLVQGCTKENIDYDALYLLRFEQIKANRGIMPKYTPTEEIQTAPNHKPLPTSEQSTLSEATLNKAKAYAEKNNSSAFIVWHKGKIQHASYFGDNTINTPLVSKSLSKPMTAIAIGRAIQLGAIKSLDQPVADFIPQWRNTEKSKVLVKHLLDMHAGFLRQGFSFDPQHVFNKAYLSYEHEKTLINDYPLVYTPGSTYSYSNAVADMVALVIEAATGQRYAEFISSEVIAKIDAQGGNVWVNRPEGLAHSGCCMLLPAESWLKLGLLLMNNGQYKGEQLLPTDYVSLMTTPTKDNKHYGLGVWLGYSYAERRGFGGPDAEGPKVLHSEPYLDSSLYLFDGNSNQVVYILPQSEMIILRLGNRPPKQPEWDNSYLPNLLVRDIQSQ